MLSDDPEMPIPPADQAGRPKIAVFGVQYVHMQVDGGDDLYVTEHGVPFVDHLHPDNYWTDTAWSAAHRAKLPGTSTIFRITTKPVRGASKDIVLKWNRMGQDIPGETEASDLVGAAFNSPFEEFSLLMELRQTRLESPGVVYTHKPLAIYVPRTHVETDQTGRRPYKIEAMQKNHTEVTLDIHRQYAVIYEWIRGIDAAEAFTAGLLDKAALARLTEGAGTEMMRKGFRVRDNKPHHLIVRPDGDSGLLKDRRGNVLYALIDFELLERTPQREQAVRASKRKAYLVKQAHRFEPHVEFPSGLEPVTVMGVDYVYGRTESTGGALWVVGRDPGLFEYFLPEKWRKTPRSKLSSASQVYDTMTKDSVHLVWRVSRVGERPDMDPFREDEKQILEYGYNSPFEEISLSMHLAGHGIDTIYPRAVYMTGHKSEVSPGLLETSRYSSHKDLQTPEGHPLLSTHHDYMIIWGYWNGPDELLAQKDEEYYRGTNALAAFREGVIAEDVYLHLMSSTRKRLAEVGVEDLNLRGTHMLLSLDRSGQLLMDSEGTPAVRICSFELLKRTEL